MARAILEGRKTQSRRVIKPQPYHEPSGRWVYDVKNGGAWQDTIKSPVAILHCCPYGQPGDRLWVRETWGPCEGGFCYRASEHLKAKPDDGRWHPAIHMFRTASRITLQIESVSVERVQNISARDAIEEGIDFKKHECGCEVCAHSTKLCPATSSSLIMEFASLWDSINAKRGFAFEKSPWVWKIVFRKL